MPVFSGAYTSAQVRDVFETELLEDTTSDRDGTSSTTIFEENESVSVGELIKSPTFSEDESSSNSCWIDLGQSPLGFDHTGQLNHHKTASPLPPFWFTSKRQSPKQVVKSYSRSMYDGKDVLSFDAAVKSVTQDTNSMSSRNLRNSNNLQNQEIQEENCSNIVNGAGSGFGSNGSSSKISSEMKDNAIRRETEGGFRLLGRRGTDEQPSRGSRVSLNIDRISHSLMDQGEASLASVYDESDGENMNEHDSDRREPEIVCNHIDHVNMLGLSKTTTRLRFLINWLVVSMLQLKIPESGGDGRQNMSLVQIYGPKIKYERGASVAFNVKDKSKGFVSPEIVLKLAEREGICLGIGILSHIRIMDLPRNHRGGAKIKEDSKQNGFVRFEVVTASLSFLTNFEDVYKLWAFIAKFLNPEFSREGSSLPTVIEEEEEAEEDSYT